MTWFEKLVGFPENNNLYTNFSYDNGVLHSHINNKSFQTGILSTPTIKELESEYIDNSLINFKSIQSDIKVLIADKNNEFATFQVASQFNLLEMIRPTTIPEDGVSIYQFDNTQGPISSICTGASTIYRNYFIELNGKIGQSKYNQINCLDLVQNYLKDISLNMQNGYCFISQEDLIKVDKLILTNKEDIKQLIKVGLLQNAEVTIDNCSHLINQVFCSAFPISYSTVEAKYWREFAKLILETTYELTFLAAINNPKSNKVYLTLVGGGAFGNSLAWIFEAIKYNLEKYKNTGLEVILVTYDYNYYVEEFFENINIK